MIRNSEFYFPGRVFNLKKKNEIGEGGWIWNWELGIGTGECGIRYAG